MRLDDLPDHGDWVKLSDDPPQEFAFGVIGRFWAGETTWETIDAVDFAAFEQPGLAKFACSISLRPYGSTRTLVSYVGGGAAAATVGERRPDQPENR